MFTPTVKLAVVPVTAALFGSVFLAGPATAAPKPGTRSLATAVAESTGGYDNNPRDYDIANALIKTRLKQNPKSPLAILTNGTKPVTVFLPNDKAFERLNAYVSGSWDGKEDRVTAKLVKKFGMKSLENFLLYHMVPGQTIDAATALKSKGAMLRTSLGRYTVTVSVDKGRVVLFDLARALPDARVVQPNINVGNAQVAHGIDRVMLPGKL